jgi:hypothetical protein
MRWQFCITYELVNYFIILLHALDGRRMVAPSGNGDLAAR